MRFSDSNAAHHWPIERGRAPLLGLISFIFMQFSGKPCGIGAAPLENPGSATADNKALFTVNVCVCVCVQRQEWVLGQQMMATIKEKRKRRRYM